VKRMLANEDKTELIEAFYKDLEFGTGGLRGIMGVGTNRMNIYTVGAATQGLSNYLNANFKDIPQISVVVGYDCRNNSDLFAKISADIFAANGIKVYLFEDMRPTPEMSFAIRHLGCQSGIILTASHNPKEYNGYKAYWDDGAQVLAPHDKGIIDEVNKITSAADIKFRGNSDAGLIQIVGEDIDKPYLEKVKTISIDPEAIFITYKIFGKETVAFFTTANVNLLDEFLIFHLDCYLLVNDSLISISHKCKRIK
jgi:phosphoglucomutase